MLSLDRLDFAGLIAGLCLLPAIAVDAGLAEICLCCGVCLAAATLFATIESLPAGSAGRSLPAGNDLPFDDGPVAGFAFDTVSFLPVPCPLYDVSLPGFSFSGLSLSLFLNLSFRYAPRQSLVSF